MKQGGPIKFSSVLSAVFVGSVVFCLLGLIVTAARPSGGLDLLIQIVIAPCYLLDFVLPWGLIPHPLVGLVICIVFSFSGYRLIGYLLDKGLQKLRRRRD
jgi:hypothetical protein